jgi:4-hydroxy-tetrahydrodipicolinate synthase
MTIKFKGVFSALVTPFHQVDGVSQVDYVSLEKLVQYQIENGINGFVVNGTTAESPTLKKSEVQKIFSMVRAQVGLNFPLILGTGSNSTETTVTDTIVAEELGADAALVVVPYYNKPPQRGLIDHFKTVARSVDIPIILYNVPGRTITSLDIDSIIELSEFKNIVGIKEASGNLIFDAELKSKIKKDFVFLSGDDGTYLDFLNLGGHGIISVMSNLLTKECIQWTQQVENGQGAEAESSFRSYKKLIDAMYVEANPIPLKWMLHKAGLIASPEMRLPLCSLDQKYYSDIADLMTSAGLLKGYVL